MSLNYLKLYSLSRSDYHSFKDDYLTSYCIFVRVFTGQNAAFLQFLKAK